MNLNDFTFVCLLVIIFLKNLPQFYMAYVNRQVIDDFYRFNDIKPKSRDKCEIEILTRGSCLVNNNRLRPKIILHFKTKPQLSTEIIQQTIDNKNQDIYSEKNKEDFEYRKQIIFEFISQLLKQMKLEYAEQLKPLVIDTVQSVQLKTYGVADVYELKINGLNDIEPLKDSVSMDNILESPVWTFNITFYVANITADFKVDVNMNEKIFVKNWDLGVRMERCSFESRFILDFDKQSLLITSFHIKSFADFKLVSEPLTWPFNDIVSNIINQEKYFIRHIIETYSQKYINMTLNNFDLNSILQKIFTET